MFTINLEDGREAPSKARKKGAKRLEFLVTYNFILEFGVFIFLHFLKDCKSGIAIFVWRITKITLTFPRLKSDYVRNINISERARMKVWLSSDQRFLFPKSYFYFKFR